MLKALWHRLTQRDDTVSHRWLSQLDQQSSRVEYEGPKIQFPIKKLVNESARWNASRLRKRA